MNETETNDAPEVAEAAPVDDNSIGDLLRAAMQETDAEAPPEPAPEPVDDSEPGGPEQATTDASDLKPPQSWTEAERAIWADLPETAREAIRRREQDFQKARFSDSKLGEVLEPLRGQLEGTGVHVDEYVKGLLQADRMVSERPLEAIMTIAQRHNLTDQLRQALGGESFDSTPASETDAMAEVKKLRAELQYQQQYNAAVQEWQSFVAERPDAEKLKRLIAAELTADSRATYADAYDRAKQLVMESAGSVSAAEERQRVEAAGQATSKARKLALPRGRTSATPEAPSSGNLRQDIADAMRRAGMMN